MKRTQFPLGRAVNVTLKSVGRTLCCAGLMLSSSAWANDLVVEGSVDETPAEIKKLSSRAAALESRIREIEQRIAESQVQLLGKINEKSVEYKLEMRVSDAIEPASAKQSVAVSHVRLSIDGRPFSYTQSAVIVAPKSPLPLFLGRLPEGTYLMRLQFQAAPMDERISNSATAAWQTLEKTLAIEVNAEAGARQLQQVNIEKGEDGLRLKFGKEVSTETPQQSRKFLEKL